MTHPVLDYLQRQSPAPCGRGLPYNISVRVFSVYLDTPFPTSTEKYLALNVYL